MRGDAGLTALVVIIITLAAAFVIFKIYGPLAEVAERGSDTELCEASVRAADTLVGRAFIEVQCPAQRLVVDAEGISRASERSAPQRFITAATGKRRLLERKVEKPDEKQVLTEMLHYALAQEMATCWNQFGEGLLEPFKSTWFSSDKHCIVCAVADVETSFIAKTGPTLSGFQQYLQTIKRPGKDETYASYLRPIKAEVERVVPFIFTTKFVQADLTVEAADTLDLTSGIVVVFQSEVPASFQALKQTFGAGGMKRAVYLVSSKDMGLLQCDAVF